MPGRTTPPCGQEADEGGHSCSEADQASYFVTLRRLVAARVLSDEQAAAYEDLYLNAGAVHCAFVEQAASAERRADIRASACHDCGEVWAFTSLNFISARRDKAEA